MKCVHCNKPLDLTKVNVVYERSQFVAHVRCVAFPSAKKTDELLLKCLKSG